MRETLNMLYRLFAPMFVVVLIVGGVGLSSELVKNSKETQSAITVAYAGACPESAIPVNNEMCKKRLWPSGKIAPLPCQAVTEKAGTITGVCTEWQGTGCCKATAWPDEQDSIKLQLKDLLGDNFLSDAIKGLIGNIGGGGGGYTDIGGTGLEAPRCDSISKRPNLPLRPGESATIAWVQSGGLSQTTTVTPGVGIVRGTSVEVAPSESTTYTVKLRNSAGEAECPAIRVHVGPADVPVDDSGTDMGDVGTDDGDYGTDIWTDGDSDGLDTTGSNYDYTGTYIPEPTETDTNNVEGVDSADLSYAPPNTVPVYTPPAAWTPGDGLANSYREPVNITKDDWYDYGDDQLYVEPAEINKKIRDNSSGLTDEEVYGIWGRPQNPTTGGIGLSGGYVGDNPDVNLNGGETPGIFTRIGSWIKKILCPWCNTGSSVSSDTYTAAAANVASDIDIAPLASCTTGSADTGVFVSKELVYKSTCDPNMTEQECGESWAGERVRVEWGVPCGNVCTLITRDSVLRPRVTLNGSLNGVVIKDTEFTLTCVNKLQEQSEYKASIKVK